MLMSTTPTEVLFLVVARLCLVFFFLPAALGKVVHQRDFVQGTIDYRVLPTRVATYVAFTLPWIELGLALSLLGGVALPLTGALTAVLLLCFIAAVTVNLYRGRRVTCNCYGIAGTAMIGWGTVARNLLLVLLAVSVTGLSLRMSGPVFSPTWPVDRLVVSSFNMGISMVLLLCFCLVTIYLVEWAVDMYYRTTQLTQVIAPVPTPTQSATKGHAKEVSPTQVRSELVAGQNSTQGVSR